MAGAPRGEGRKGLCRRLARETHWRRRRGGGAWSWTWRLSPLGRLRAESQQTGSRESPSAPSRETTDPGRRKGMATEPPQEATPTGTEAAPTAGPKQPAPPSATPSRTSAELGIEPAAPARTVASPASMDQQRETDAGHQLLLVVVVVVVEIGESQAPKPQRPQRPPATERRWKGGAEGAWPRPTTTGGGPQTETPPPTPWRISCGTREGAAPLGGEREPATTTGVRSAPRRGPRRWRRRQAVEAGAQPHPARPEEEGSCG